jgi:gas vesicle protein
MPVFMPRGARVRPINAERETRVRDVYADETARSVIERYLEGVRAAWGSYIDSASGEERRIDGQAVSLLLLKSKCFDDICDSDDRAQQEVMICPISQKIMRDPVKCSDGLTYERRSIEEWAKRSKTGVYHQPLEFEQQGDACKLCCQPNKEILEKIKQFKEEKRKELEDLKQSAEGEEEKRILRSRLGYTWRDGDSKRRKEEGLIDSEEQEFWNRAS